MLQMHQSALRGRVEHFALPLCCQDALVISRGAQVVRGKKVPLTKLQKENKSLSFPFLPH